MIISFDVITGNFITFIGALLTIVMGLAKTKRSILTIQCFQCGVYSLANFVLGGYSGAVQNVITIFRNIFAFNNDFTFKAKLIFILLQVVLGLFFNRLGLVGLLPIIAGVSFTWFVDSKSEILLKVVIILDNLLWVYYNIVINSYISLAVNAFAIISNIMGIYIIKRSKKVTV